MHRVVITGFAVLSATGSDPTRFWEQLASGRSGLGPLTRVRSPLLSTGTVGEINDFYPEQHFGKEIELLDRFAQFGVVCARGALAHAGLPRRLDQEGSPYAPERVAVLTGTGMGGIGTQDQGFRQMYGEGNHRVHPFLIPRAMYSAASSHIGMDTGARGPSFTISTACASSTHALGEAWRRVRDGSSDMVIAGGSDAPLTFGVIKAWEAMRVLAPAGDDPSRACRPFSRDRGGLVLAEGAAMFVLESEEGAARRGAAVLAELAGYGASADAGHITQPTLEGPAQAMREAMSTAGLGPEEVDYINAHGTGTKLNDATEIAAIKAVFGEQAERLSISSTKSMHGHAMGASGAIELAATLLALQHQVVPPTANFTTPDPECDLDVTPNQAKPRPLRAALSNSFAFGGLNAVLAVRRRN
ncbi:MAG TPA: beta-ketoacyl-[acyl-carrier-protein] synthase family protein [Terriglobales bacterium]|nr:beta-ketoacyl-[acyl-carrier-protein] synthase family protein [Terriglobales bacterium]